MNKNILLNKRYVLIVLAGVVLLAGFIFALVNKPADIAKTETPATNSAPVVQQAQEVSYTGEAGKTALAQLKETTENVVTKTSSMGEYVDSIGELKGGQDGKYWTFYVDGVMASIGADGYVAKGGEAIVWKFVKL